MIEITEQKTAEGSQGTLKEEVIFETVLKKYVEVFQEDKEGKDIPGKE